MTPKILTFPTDEAAKLQLEGYVLIAWHREPGLGDDEGWLWGLWKPSDGKGWYRSGYRTSPCPSATAPGGVWPAHLSHFGMSRKGALQSWRCKFVDPYGWHYLMSEAAAFPEKRRRYLRTPRALAHA